MPQDLYKVGHASAAWEIRTIGTIDNGEGKENRR
jgi:hypothetical protein